MNQLDPELPPFTVPREDSLHHRLQHARYADGKERLQRVDEEIDDNLFSSAQLEFRQNSSAHSSPYLSIPHHNGTSRAPPHPADRIIRIPYAPFA